MVLLGEQSLGSGQEISRDDQSCTEAALWKDVILY